MTVPDPRRARGFGSRLAADSVVYGLGGMANQAVAILLVPIYARHLGPAGVGVAGVLNSAISLALMVVGLALPNAFFRWYLRESRTITERRHVLATTLTIRVVASVVGFAVILFAAVPLTLALYDGDYLPVFLLVAPIVAFDSFASIPLSFLRAERRPRDYVAISITRAAVGTVGILALVVVADVGVVGVALGGAVAAGLSAIVGLIVLFRAGLLGMAWDAPLARTMLAFALPLVPAATAGWVLNLSDRPLLQLMTGDQELVGVYSLGYTAGLVISAMIIQPFSLAWGAAFWEISRSPDAPRIFARSLTWYLAIASGAALLLTAVATDAIRILLGPEFEESRYIVPFSSFAYALYGAYVILATGLNVVGRSRQVAVTMGVAAVATVLLNLLLIPTFGMYGAAISTLAGYLLLAVASGIVSQRHYPVPWQLGRAAMIVLIAAALAAASLIGPDHALWRVVCAAAYVPMLLALGIVKLDQGRALLRLVQRR